MDVFMYHNDEGYNKVKHYAAITGLIPREPILLLVSWAYQDDKPRELNYYSALYIVIRDWSLSNSRGGYMWSSGCQNISTL